jgi:hypothetical protein
MKAGLTGAILSEKPNVKVCAHGNAHAILFMGSVLVTSTPRPIRAVAHGQLRGRSLLVVGP